MESQQHPHKQQQQEEDASSSPPNLLDPTTKKDLEKKDEDRRPSDDVDVGDILITTTADDNSSSSNVVVHPMVPVPEAILTVLRESSRIAVLVASADSAAAAAAAAAAQGDDEAPTTTQMLESLRLYDKDDDDGLIDCGAGPGRGEDREPTTLASPSRRRTLARDVVVPSPGYPPYRASVMDGYAISTQSYPPTKVTAEDSSGNSGAGGGDEASGTATRPSPRRRLFHVVGKVHAGDGEDDGVHGPAPEAAGVPPAAPTTATKVPEDGRLPTACYVTTGAVVPDVYDCVVPLEDVIVANASDATTTTTTIELLDTADVRPGRWIRAVGFDLPPGTVVARAGQILDSTMIGLLRQAGRTTVDVLPRVRVGVLSTGNEIVDDPNWFQQAKGTIPDVNRPVLMSLYRSWNICDVIDLGIVQDSDDAAIRDALVQAIDQHKCQVVVTTGGISMGEMDRMEAVLTSLDATLHFGRLHMKPGKPTTFATIRDNRMVFCLPGNPVSAVVCSHLLVRPCLDLLYQAPLVLLPNEHEERAASLVDQQRQVMEELAVLHPEVPVTMQNDVVLDVERPEYHRVRLRPVIADAASGAFTFEAHSTGVQQSSRLASMSGAHALVLLPQATPELRKVTKGTVKRALLLDDSNGIFPRLRLHESLHMQEGMATVSQVEAPRSPTAKDAPLTLHDDGIATKRLLNVDVVLVRCVKPAEAAWGPADASEMARQVQKALEAGPSSSFRVVSSRAFTYPVNTFDPLTVWKEAIVGGDTSTVDTDVQIVAYEGPMLPQLKLAMFLKTALSKLAPALEMDARQGIATESSTAAALFDVVVGVVDASSIPTSIENAAARQDAEGGDRTPASSRCRLVLLLPAASLWNAMSSIRRQIRHAIKVAQQSS